MHRIFNRITVTVFIAMGVALTSVVQAETVLKASHQFPGGKGDVRDEMVQMIARDVEKANVGLKIQVYPGESLFKAKEQWGAITKGQVAAIRSSAPRSCPAW